MAKRTKWLHMEFNDSGSNSFNAAAQGKVLWVAFRNIGAANATIHAGGLNAAGDELQPRESNDYPQMPDCHDTTTYYVTFDNRGTKAVLAKILIEL